MKCENTTNAIEKKTLRLQKQKLILNFLNSSASYATICLLNIIKECKRIFFIQLLQDICIGIRSLFLPATSWQITFVGMMITVSLHVVS